ncbi:nascent polypeptide-associated complex protein [Candidatus Pacearchaeota archaeon]|nr:nascent polypeptide-associated complex protein [Candidatus Pacearchaeota archaeon]
MFPGLGGGLDPKKMQAMMKQLGMNQEEIDAKRVVIEKSDNSKLIIENPSVVKITIKGQESFQISGDVKEQEAGISEADIQTVMEKTGVSMKEAKKALESTNGDLAEAILSLS